MKLIKKKILILGITSIIGYRFYQLNRKTFNIYGVCRNCIFDQKDNIYIKKIIDINVVIQIINEIEPDIIMNCISIGNVDKCEENNLYAEKINFSFAKELVDLTNQKDIRLINFSSSLIYDGLSENYIESSRAHPLNEYGKLKLRLDTYIRKNLKNSLLIRPTTIYGVKESFQRDNPVNFIINKICNSEKLSLVDDVVTNLLYIDDLVDIIQKLITNNINGEFNVGGDKAVSRYELGRIIKELIPQSKSNIVEYTSNEFKTIARRPLNIILVNNKIKKTISAEFTSLETSILKIIQSRKE